MWIELLCGSVHENNWNITTYEQDTLTHFKPMLYFNTPSKVQKNRALV